ncbi:hypothetical protein C8Q80DRAFT_1266315 [Daedaleopsis nitida]|nr:hypothetical protein C8Q80DRAFT_1266315 [Daedaleopsis nitida]
MQPNGPGLTASVATRTRSAYPPSWSVAVPQPYCPNRRSVNRVVATDKQRAILLRLYARVGDDPTREELDEVVKETGLSTKWIRKWINRQRTKDPRGKSARKSHSSTGSNSGSPSGDPSAVPASEHNIASASASPVQSCLMGPFRYSSDISAHQPRSPDLAPDRPSPVAPGLKLTVFPPATVPQPQPLSGPGVSGPIDVLTSPDVASRTTWWGLPLDAPPSANTVSGHPAESGGSFSVPFRSASQPYPNHAVDGCLYPGLQDFSGQSTLRQMELNAAYMQSTAMVSHPQPPGGPTPTTIAPQALYISPPSDLTNGAQYLFNILYGDSNATEAPPAVPPFSSTSACYFPELTRPLDGSSASLCALPVSMRSHHAFAHDAMPISYQTRLSDLISATREARRSASNPETPKTVPSAGQASMDPLLQPSPYGQATNLATGKWYALDTLGSDLQYSVATPKVGSAHARVRFLVDTDAMMTVEDEETEDEREEAVTPCEEANFVLDLPLKSTSADENAKGASIESEQLTVVGMVVEED